ncbi:MAG: BtrH N-terminal domain-containing protein [Planctomycetes bacterium]|nr:BtrH N-terminal domain-containing protein [Planctomycetota bacterium]
MRKVLESVPAIGYQDCDCTFSGCVCSTLKYLGKQASHAIVQGLCGSAFKLFWHKRWCPSNGSYFGGRETLLGYYGLDFENTVFEPDKYDRADWPQSVRSSIDAGVPVISAGIVGPPECVIITGYDGERLIGLSYFHEYRKCFERDDWVEDCHGLLLIRGAAKRDQATCIRESIC